MTWPAFDVAAPLGVTAIDEAVLVPFGSEKAKGVHRPAGVLDRQGAPVAAATCLRDSQTPVTTAPPPVPPPTRRLAGTWLYGGMLYGHFGHFLCESTARLWALPQAGPIAGVVFLPKPRLDRPARLLRGTAPWLRMAGVDLPIEAPMEPVAIDRLILPEQGFGTGDMVAGKPEYRAWAHREFGAKIAAQGSDKLYISRSRLYSRRGRILGEQAFENLLEAQGYTVFHPQEAPIEEQVARYKAARWLISTDCSALHLAAFFAAPGDQVAILARRPGRTIGDFLAQYAQFAGLVPLTIDRLTATHHAEGARLAQMSEVYAEVDYPALCADLVAGGFLRLPLQWTPPDRAALDAELAGWLRPAPEEAAAD